MIIEKNFLQKPIFFRPNDFKEQGFTLIESLVFLFIFSVITMAFYSTINLGMRYIMDSKDRLVAIALANEKIEAVRGMYYGDIGIIGGIPSGSIPREEVVQRDNRSYRLNHLVEYVDDYHDGVTGGTPDDDNSNDYKKMSVSVFWYSGGQEKSISISSIFFSPKTLSNGNTGSLLVKVINRFGEAVPGAFVRISNNSVTPVINVAYLTDNDGTVFIAGAPESNQGYKIEVTKSGYYGVTSYPPYPVSSFNPIDVYTSVVKGDMSEKIIILEQEANISLKTVDYFGNIIPNVAFSLSGGRKIGSTVVKSPQEPAPVFDFDGNYNSGSSGDVSIQGESPGNYLVDFSTPSDDFGFLLVEPNQASREYFSVSPGSNSEAKIVLFDKRINSLLVDVYNKKDNSPIEGAGVRLKSDALGYDAVVVSDRYGQAYFPSQLPELNRGDYQILVSADGFSDGDASINIDKYVRTSVALLPKK